MNIDQLHKLFLDSTVVCRDTRQITSDCMYFALKGENFNGNHFTEDALKKGAKYAIVDEAAYNLNDNCILVENTLTTLQQLAKYHRAYLGIKIVALTGSNGKTTTKELINAVLQKKYKTVATVGNLNNHIGVPLTLLSMNQQTEIGIVEMGANHLKEIEFLCSLAQTDYGYITNFGKAHLEGFGSIEGVIKGKSEMYDYLKAHDKLIFINSNDSKQIELLKSYSNFYSFGSNTKVDCTTNLESSNPFVVTKFNNTSIISKLIGSYNYNNISAAITIGNYFNIKKSDIKNAIEGYIPENNRSQIIQKGSNQIILDAYNANPTSMAAALDNFNNVNTQNKVAILGDMFELGDDAMIEHQHIVELTNHLSIENVYLVGENFNKAELKSNKITLCKTFESLKKAILTKPITDSSILIKGSRGMALERILDFL